MTSYHQSGSANGDFANDADHAGHIETDANDAAAMEQVTALAGNMTVEENEAFREKARAAGWSAVPSNMNYHQTDDDAFAEHAKHHAVYEWDDEYGEVGPEQLELEKQLFNDPFRTREGDKLENLHLKCSVDGPLKLYPVRSFQAAGLHPLVLDTVINKIGWNRTTSIQAYTIPAVLSGNDVVAVSQTGSGKTAAYLIPVISRLMGKAKQVCAPRPKFSSTSGDVRNHRVKAEPIVVIVVPTQELAAQVFHECRRFCYRSMLRPVFTCGGQHMGVTLDQLSRGADILISTPGRLCDLMNRPEVLSMSRVLYTIIDEADEMLHGDWETEMSKIMGGGDANEDADHVYMMFSATFPKEIRKVAREYLTPEHYRLAVGRPGSTHMNITQDVINVAGYLKMQACFDLLMDGPKVRTLIFCNGKHTVDALDAYLYQRHLPVTAIHSNRGQREREFSLRAFRHGEIPILVATGVSARGLDVAGIMHVINFDLPSTSYGGITEYVHRIGRTGRIGNEGRATSFYDAERDQDIASALVNILLEQKCEIPDFLAEYVPADGQAVFDDESDDEDDEDDEAAADPAFTSDAAGFTADAGAGFSADAGNGFSADETPAATAPGAW